MPNGSSANPSHERAVSLVVSLLTARPGPDLTNLNAMLTRTPLDPEDRQALGIALNALAAMRASNVRTPQEGLAVVSRIAVGLTPAQKARMAGISRDVRARLPAYSQERMILGYLEQMLR